jgi:hypothetical protein
MPVFDIIMLSVAAVLAVYLRFSVRRRVRKELHEQWQAHEREWAGRGLDVLAVTKQVQRLRQDYLAAVQSRSHNTSHRLGLVASARHVIMCLSYFRSPKAAASTDHDADTHTASSQRRGAA